MGLFSDWRAFHRAIRAHGGGLRILKEAARDLASLKEPMAVSYTHLTLPTKLEV